MSVSPPPRSSAAPAEPVSAGASEPRLERAGRYARRTLLYTWATLLVIALVAIIVLIAENTHRVRVGWIFGYSRISLVFLVVFAVLLGWILGIATSILFRLRTRRRL